MLKGRVILKKRYILIDSENVQNRLFEIIEKSRKKDKIIIFYTVYHSGRLEEFLKTDHKKKNIEFVECMTGDNALDLQLMGVLAYLVQKHPRRGFVVYSNDKGYVAAVRHWQKLNVDVELVSFTEPAVAAFQFKPKPNPKNKKKKTAANNHNPYEKNTSKPTPPPKQLIKDEKTNIKNAVNTTVNLSEKKRVDRKTVVTDALLASSAPQKTNTQHTKEKTKNDPEAISVKEEKKVVPDKAKEMKPESDKETKIVSDKVNKAADEIKTEIETKNDNENKNVLIPTVSDPETEAALHKMSNAEYIIEMCRSVRSTDLALVNRVLTIGFGSEDSKEIYAHFKTDSSYRQTMLKLYLPTKPQRLKSLMKTALRFNDLEDTPAGEICAIINEKGTKNMQVVYRDFMKRMPGTLAERQNIYKVVKPYLAVITNL